MLALIAVACAFAAGWWLIVSAVWPAPKRLAVALSQLHSARIRLGFVSADGRNESLQLKIGRWLVRRLKARAFADERTASDLELVGRPLELYAGTRAMCAIGGALIGPALWTAVAAVGTPLPFVFPIWSMIVGVIA